MVHNDPTTLNQTNNLSLKEFFESRVHCPKGDMVASREWEINIVGVVGIVFHMDESINPWNASYIICVINYIKAFFAVASPQK